VEGRQLVEGDLLKNGHHQQAGVQDCKLHVEFRLPFIAEVARGQGRANSGVYVQTAGRSRCSTGFGWEARTTNAEAFTRRRPRRSRVLPADCRGMTFDIEFTRAEVRQRTGKRTAPAVITVLHNGVKSTTSWS